MKILRNSSFLKTTLVSTAFTLLNLVSLGQTVFTVRNDGTILKNNIPFFPYGFYLDSETKTDLNAMFDQVKTIGQAGFNIAHVEPSDNSPIANVFTEAQSHNMYLIYSPAKRVGISGLHLVYDGVKNQPNLMAYGIGDDVHDNTPMVGYPGNVDNLQAIYDDAKAYDPIHLSFVALGNGTSNGATFTKNRFDIPAQEIYPINGGSAINLVYSATKDVVIKAARWHQSPWGCLQTFNPGENVSQRYPTPAEYYNMLYQAIVAGAKGIINYTYSGPNSGAISNNALWEECKATIPEIESIKSFLMNGTITRKEVVPGIYAATWELENQVLAIVVNAGSYKSYINPATNLPYTRNVSIPLPDGTQEPAKAVFAGRPSGMIFNDGKLTGSINLLDVHIYKFDKISVGINRIPFEEQ